MQSICPFAVSSCIASLSCVMGGQRVVHTGVRNAIVGVGSCGVSYCSYKIGKGYFVPKEAAAQQPNSVNETTVDK